MGKNIHRHCGACTARADNVCRVYSGIYFIKELEKMETLKNLTETIKNNKATFAALAALVPLFAFVAANFSEICSFIALLMKL
jgi:hypothetical protein